MKKHEGKTATEIAQITKQLNDIVDSSTRGNLISIMKHTNDMRNSLVHNQISKVMADFENQQRFIKSLLETNPPQIISDQLKKDIDQIKNLTLAFKDYSVSGKEVETQFRKRNIRGRPTFKSSFEKKLNDLPNKRFKHLKTKVKNFHDKTQPHELVIYLYGLVDNGLGTHCILYLQNKWVGIPKSYKKHSHLIT